MSLEKEVKIPEHQEKLKKEILNAIQNLPDNTLTPNGKHIQATKMIPINTFYFGLEDKSQLKIPKDAKNIEEYKTTSATAFQYKGLNYFIGFNN